MKLITMLLVLASEEKWRTFGALRPFNALLELAGRLRGRFGEREWFNGPAGVLLTTAPGVAGVLLFQAALGTVGGLIGWLIGLLFAVVVLIASIGRRGVDDEVDAYRDAVARGDDEAAFLHVRILLAGAAPEDAEALHRRVIERMLVRHHERLLGVLFWFVVLGPAGAVLYRSAVQLKEAPPATDAAGDPIEEAGYREAVLRLHAWLDWIPVRLTALCQALVGSFSDALAEWRIGAAMAPDIRAANLAVLVGSGFGALRLPVVLDRDAEVSDADARERSLGETRALLQRVSVLWVSAFGLLTLVGWLS